MAVYYVRLADTDLIKIGYSCDPYRRTFGLANQFHTDATLLGFEPGDGDREAEVHAEFEFCRYPGAIEVFRPSLELLQKIKSVAVEPFTVAYRTREQYLAERRLAVC